MNSTLRLPSKLELAINVAVANSYPKINKRMAAVLVSGGRVLSVGVNRFRNENNPSIPREAWTVHAEHDCLSRVDLSNSDGATLYVARVGARNNPRFAKPCPACENWCESYGIRKVIYTIDERSYGTWKLT